MSAIGSGPPESRQAATGPVPAAVEVPVSIAPYNYGASRRLQAEQFNNQFGLLNVVFRRGREKARKNLKLELCEASRAECC